MTSTHVSRAKTSRATRTHARPSVSRRALDSHPKLGNFFRVSKDAEPLSLELETAIKDTGPGSPAIPADTRHGSPLSSHFNRYPGRALLLIPLSPEELLERAANYESLASAADDSPVSTVDDDSLGLSEILSVGVPISPATAATSVEDSQTEEAPFLPDPCVDVSSSLPTQLSSLVGVAQQFPNAHNFASATGKINWDEYNLVLYHINLSNTHRMKLALLADIPRTSSFAEKLILPWNKEGQYTNGTSPQIACIHKAISRHVIEPLYRIDKQLQLGILDAWLDNAVRHDDLSRSKYAASNQPVHVFVDMSNIIIGFYNKLKAGRGIAPWARVQAPPFFFEGFAHCLERRRPYAKRVVVTSQKSGAATTPGYLLEAEAKGYEVQVLQRVSGSKKSRRSNNNCPYGAQGANYYTSDSDLETGSREQMVDELLHLKMMQSLIDCPEPGTMVLATGDAADAEFSDGFHKNVVRALERGWHVEVIAFEDNTSSAWKNPSFMKKWPYQFRVWYLDALVEELMAGYHL